MSLTKKITNKKKEFKETASKINNKTLKFNKEAKDNGDLFGSIKPKEISTAFIDQLKIEINPAEINLTQSIDKIGKYKVEINLHAEVNATINILVDKTD